MPWRITGMLIIGNQAHGVEGSIGLKRAERNRALVAANVASSKLLDVAIHFAGQHFRTEMEMVEGFAGPGDLCDLDEIDMTSFGNEFLPAKLTASGVGLGGSHLACYQVCHCRKAHAFVVGLPISVAPAEGVRATLR